MEKRILEKLREVESDREVDILFAVESGSRAWGFASPDSDYDIRFVYKHETPHYLNLWEQNDTIQFMTADDLDGSGWDLKKTLLLLSKSNASLLGWLFSPIVYSEKSNCLSELKTLATSNFNPIAGFHHYNSMNKGFNDVLNQDMVNLKNFFYAVRTALCANWIVKEKTIPPVLFTDLYSLIDSKSQFKLNELIKVKSELNEKGSYTLDSDLKVMLQNIIEENREGSEALVSVKRNADEFNQLFLKQLL